MVDTPAFDPYAILGVGFDADEIVIQLAYRARIRGAHPDLAGPAGLERAKRLNVARDWLLDPVRRARLGSAHSSATTTGGRSARTDRGHRRREAFDHGAHASELRAFLHALELLSPDERARVNYSLGEARPPDLQGYVDYLEPVLQARSRDLRDAVERMWARGVDEQAPLVPRLGRLLPTGFLVANAFAQWLLLEDALRAALAGLVVRGEYVIESLAARCVGPWSASVGQPRYGPRGQDVQAFFSIARNMQADGAERLARSWRGHLGRDGRGHPSEHLGPGVWLPAPANYPEVLRVSGYVAAVDASRITPPEGLDERHHASYRFGLRLTAHALALGLVNDPTRDYLRPWRDAIGPGYWAQHQPQSSRSAG